MSESGDRWRRDTEASTASGGQVSSDLGTGPLFDPLDAPLPSEVARDREGAGAHPPPPSPRREVIPDRPARQRNPKPQTTSESRRRRTKPATRRVKRMIKHVDPIGVLKVSSIMYTIFLGLWLVFVAIFYSFLDSLGLFDAIQKLSKDLVLTDSARITLGAVEKWAFILGLVVMVIALLVNVFVSFIYNIIADVVGGVEVTFVERDAS
ncbi:MAG: DUF3566 domain-containing protein [Actinobacteria bacterium]|nr:DUF3566 domain-containing protein [Actinomycetota bacterium]